MVIEGKITEQIMKFNHLQNKISEYKRDRIRITTHNVINGIIKRYLLFKCLMRQK